MYHYSVINESTMLHILIFLKAEVSNVSHMKLDAYFLSDCLEH